MSSNNTEYNKDELEAPEWLNVEFFTKVLQESEKDSKVEMKNCTISPASMKGDHYASVMFRAAVEYRKQNEVKTKSLIIKTMPEAKGHKLEMFRETHAFETEIGMYTKVIPKFEQILSNIGDHTKIAAQCLYYTLSPRPVIVFEDIVPLDYIVIRDRDATIDEVKGAYLKIAKWHAISYKIASEDTHFFDQYKYGVMLEKNFVESDFVICGIKRFLKFLDTVPALIMYKPYFEALQENLVKNCIDSFDEYRENPQEKSLYVLCHGDFHLKNMMFKLKADTKAYEDVLLLDYQFCYMGPMVNDIIYSLYLVANANIRANHFDELLEYYFSNFVVTLERLGFKGRFPKMNELKSLLFRYRFYELFIIVTFLPAWYSVRSGDTDLENMLTSEEYSQSLYNNDDYIAELQDILPKLLHLGYFNK